MGNNHDKYFGKEKRKILVLGLPQSGKTSLVEVIVQGKQANLKVQKTKDLNIRDANLQGLSVTFFDLAGGDRQRIFWKQHYEGTQGIIFLIDSSSPQQKIQTSISQLDKISKNQMLKDIPIAICLNKSDQLNQQQTKVLQKRVLEIIKNMHLQNIPIIRKSRVFITNVKLTTKIKQMMVWLLKQTKPL